MNVVMMIVIADNVSHSSFFIFFSFLQMVCLQHSQISDMGVEVSHSNGDSLLIMLDLFYSQRFGSGVNEAKLPLLVDINFSVSSVFSVLSVVLSILSELSSISIELSILSVELSIVSLVLSESSAIGIDLSVLSEFSDLSSLSSIGIELSILSVSSHLSSLSVLSEFSTVMFSPLSTSPLLWKIGAKSGCSDFSRC